MLSPNCNLSFRLRFNSSEVYIAGLAYEVCVHATACAAADVLCKLHNMCVFTHSNSIAYRTLVVDDASCCFAQEEKLSVDRSLAQLDINVLSTFQVQVWAFSTCNMSERATFLKAVCPQKLTIASGFTKKAALADCRPTSKLAGPYDSTDLAPG